jgi:IclR family pca regulon transcriptional regulator
MTVSSKRPKYFSESLARGLRVISAFDRSASTLRISEVAKRTGLMRAAARRYLLTLQDLGYVGADADQFFLRPKVLQIGFSYFSSMNVDHIVQPYLNDLAEKTRETSSFAILDGVDAMFIARAASKRILSFTIGIGGRIPAYSTALGFVLLAGLSQAELEQRLDVLPKASAEMGIPTKKMLRDVVRETRQQGWAGVDGRQHADSITSLAVPIVDRMGATTAAMNIMQYPARDKIQTLVKQYLPALRDTAAQIGAALDASGHFAMSVTRNVAVPGAGTTDAQAVDRVPSS